MKFVPDFKLILDVLGLKIIFLLKLTLFAVSLTHDQKGALFSLERLLELLDSLGRAKVSPRKKNKT